MLAYDPMIAGLACVTGTASPIYVDSLASLVQGNPHPVAAQMFLVAAGHCAGLVTAAWLPAFSQEAWRVLEHFLAHAARALGAWEISGLPSPPGAGGPADAFETVVVSRCSCAIKTAMVLVCELGGWRACLRDSPFGPGAVQPCARYLGVAVGSCMTGTAGMRGGGRCAKRLGPGPAVGWPPMAPR